MTTKGEIRKARKAARVAGRPWMIETGPSGHLEIVRTRTRREEASHARRMDRWARNYERLNGAPEGPDDY